MSNGWHVAEGGRLRGGAHVCVRLYDERTYYKLVKVLAGKETNEGVQTALVICNVFITLETH